MDDEFAKTDDETGDETAKFGAPEASYDFEKCETLKEPLMDAFVSHIGKEQQLQAETPFDLMQYVAYTVSLLEGE